MLGCYQEYWAGPQLDTLRPSFLWAGQLPIKWWVDSHDRMHFVTSPKLLGLAVNAIPAVLLRPTRIEVSFPPAFPFPQLCVLHRLIPDSVALLLLCSSPGRAGSCLLAFLVGGFLGYCCAAASSPLHWLFLAHP